MKFSYSTVYFFLINDCRYKKIKHIQYTGLTDRNGNNIWENDIVERTDRRNGLCLFREQPKMNCKVVYSHRHGFDTEPSCGYFDNKSALECKVIGNVFDNKKLLKGSEQE